VGRDWQNLGPNDDISRQGEELLPDLHWLIVREKPLTVKGIVPPDGSRDNYIYKIHEWSSDRWQYERSDTLSIGPVRIGSLKGEAATYEEAKAKLEQDWERLQSLQAWLEFMVNNPPPA